MPGYSIDFSQIPHYALLLSSFGIAVLCITFFWGFVDYIFFKGDDAKRAHAKMLMVTSTVLLMLLIIIWWIGGFSTAFIPGTLST